MSQGIAMFENLTERLTQTFRNLRGVGRLTEENIQGALADIRYALLDADVALPIVKKFIEDVKTVALGQNVSLALNPEQAFIKLVNDELTKLMGEVNVGLNLNAQPPAVILMAGLQGSGKTTTSAKLANFLKTQEKKRVMLVSCDVYRPAAIDQLKTLAQKLEVEFFQSEINQAPEAIAKAAIRAAKDKMIDVLIVDTAGRLHIDDEMMNEIKVIHRAINPIETLFVVDSMTGQDAANTAKVFHDALPLTGVILTKADGDARGGAALSIRYITGKPIKFMGMGEKIEALEPFYPERLAQRILGMGDVLSLIEEAEKKLDKTKTEKMAKKLQKGRGFDLMDYRDQMQQMLSMGGMASLMDKLPGMGQMKSMVQNKINDKTIIQSIAIINSMTKKERRFPDLIKGSRKARIAKGSGTQLPDVNRVLKQFDQMQKMTKKMMQPGAMQKMMRGMQGMFPGGFPGGGFPGQ